MSVLPAQTEIEAERARRSLSLFVRLAWHVLEPGPLEWSWHLDLLCARLEAVAREEVRRLLVNLPPRHGKSLMCSVFFPAWVWASDPSATGERCELSRHSDRGRRAAPAPHLSLG